MKNNIKKALAFGVFIFGLAISTSHVFCGQNAGVLPFAKWRGEIYFLIGKDIHYKASRQNLWSDFGGKHNSGEKPYQTANREFHEETGRFFRKSVNKGTFYMENKSKSYRTYLVEINAIDTKILLSHVKRRSVQEKSDFAWVSLRELVHKIAGMDIWNADLKLRVIQGSLNNGTETEVVVAPIFSQLLNYNFISKHINQTNDISERSVDGGVVIVVVARSIVEKQGKSVLNVFLYKVKKPESARVGGIILRNTIEEREIELNNRSQSLFRDATPGRTYSFVNIADIHGLITEPQHQIALSITEVSYINGGQKKIIHGFIYRLINGAKKRLLGRVEMETNRLDWDPSEGEYLFYQIEGVWNVQGIEKVTIYPTRYPTRH